MPEEDFEDLPGDSPELRAKFGSPEGQEQTNTYMSAENKQPHISPDDQVKRLADDLISRGKMTQDEADRIVGIARKQSASGDILTSKEESEAARPSVTIEDEDPLELEEAKERIQELLPRDLKEAPEGKANEDEIEEALVPPLDEQSDAGEPDTPKAQEEKVVLRAADKDPKSKEAWERTFLSDKTPKKWFDNPYNRVGLKTVCGKTDAEIDARASEAKTEDQLDAELAARKAAGNGGDEPPPPTQPHTEAPEPEENRPQNEILKRMGYNNDNQIADPNLRAIVLRLGVMPSTGITGRILEKQLMSLYDEQLRNIYDQTEFNNIAANINQWASDIYDLENRRQSGNVNQRPDEVRQPVRQGGQELQSRLRDIRERRVSDVETQRKMARELLNDIESNNYTLTDITNSQNAKELRAALPFFSPEVAKEVRARLRLHACVVVITRISGKPDELPHVLRGMVTELSASGDLLTGEDFDFFFKENGKDLRTGEYFDQLEDEAFQKMSEDVQDNRELEGKSESESKIIKKQQEERRRNNDQRRNDEREAAFGIGFEADKAKQLATRLAKATFETSVWNFSASPPDAIGEAIYIKRHRMSTGVDFGPPVTINVIDGFGTSFLRNVEKYNKEKLFNNEQWNNAKNTSDIKEALKEVLKVNRMHGVLRNDTGYKLNVRDNDGYSQIKEEEYGKYLSSYLPAILTVKNLLLKSDYKPDDFSEDAVQSFMSPMIKADPEGILRLSSMHALGALDEGIRQYNRLGWGQVEIQQAINTLESEKRLKDPDTGKVYVWQYVNEEQMDFILGKLKTGRRGFWSDILTSLQGRVKIRR